MKSGRKKIKITHVYMDLDSAAYVGACLAEKRAYIFRNKVTGETSQEFSSASKAKGFITQLEGFEDEDDDDEFKPENWERETIIKHQPESIAIKFVKNEIDRWVKAAKKATGNNDVIIKGYLTSSGIKTKDIKGIENRYQHNRYIDEENWIPAPKPKHLKACRNYILNSYDWVKMSPKGIEADAVVIFMAEKRGYNACILSKDKDLKQAVNTNFMDMNTLSKDNIPKVEKLDEVGYLEVIEKVKAKEYKGTGFKLLCMQTMAGDPSDGYHGINLVGGATAIELLGDCKTVNDCCEALVSFYKETFKDGHSYTSWDKQEKTLTWKEMLIQHMTLAYQERGPKDTVTPIERFFNNEDPIFRY